MIALAIILGVGLAWLAREFLTAPVGYEDAAGFHLGTEPFNPPALTRTRAQATSPGAEPFGVATAARAGGFRSAASR